MRTGYRRTAIDLLSLVAMFVATCVVALPMEAWAGESPPAEKPEPVTTSDPEIPVDHLKLLVKPLTKEDLAVEADAWRDLLKAKVQRIAELQIAVRKHDDIAQAAEASAEGDGTDSGEGPEATESESGDAAADQKAEAANDRKEQLAESLPQLQEEQVTLAEQLEVVLDAFEKKGGEVEAYRQYVSAVSGVEFDVTDTATTWTVIKGWLASEQGGQRWAWNIARFLLTLAVFYFAARIISALARRAALRVSGASQLLVDFLGKFLRQLIMVVGLIVALAALEVNIGPLLAVIGAAGFVVGFALQDTLSNFASGLLILAYRPFDVGHVIEAADVSGIVDSVSLFSTHIRTFDNKVMIVPNNAIWGSTITNATATDTRRVDLVFGIGYQDDIDQAKSILENIVKGHELVLDEPAPTIQLNELGDSSLNFICRPWTKTANYWTVYWDITRAVKDEFDRNGISIPFPQRDIHVYQQEGATTSA